MKKYLVIGNPINHSLSPEIHNYWLKKNNIDAVYEKKKINHENIKNIIEDIRNAKINGINVTVPFKKHVIPFLDDLSEEASITQSVNTILLENDKIIGYNTDIVGFQLSLKRTKYDLKNKKVFILGSGGVVPSILFSLEKSGVSEIILSNRTKEKADGLKKTFPNLNIVEWGIVPEFDIIINATSLGLNKGDKINLKFSNINQDKFFYDVIYNPKETNFLKTGKNFGAQVLNGKMMFIYQASEAFKLWHKINPEINQEILKLLDK
tara:strand:+ start:2592 stop:3386 length:795 start_codon:yes stop_codon:yes gene_type:complete